jgi:hypothetical protein
VSHRPNRPVHCRPAAGTAARLQRSLEKRQRTQFRRPASAFRLELRSIGARRGRIGPCHRGRIGPDCRDRACRLCRQLDAWLRHCRLSAAGLMTMLVLSAAYNVWPVSRAKWFLRRLDHSAIFVLIAATYTPLLVKAGAGSGSTALLIGVWLVRSGASCSSCCGRAAWVACRLFFTCCSAGRARLPIRWWRPSRLRRCGLSQAGGCCIRQASCFICGKTFAFKMRLGMSSCCLPPPATTPQCLVACLKPERGEVACLERSLPQIRRGPQSVAVEMCDHCGGAPTGGRPISYPHGSSLRRVSEDPRRCGLPRREVMRNQLWLLRVARLGNITRRVR